jgi:hypothetical protein
MSMPAPPGEVLHVPLRCGALTLHVEHALLPLDELCTFASRRNPKRGFLIVSKVLGKHVPVRPSLMQRVHQSLAGQLKDLKGPVVVVALAETAIGLGQGVFDALAISTRRRDTLFLHSTRYRLDRPLACKFREGHSHAPEHLLYLPADPDDAALLRAARTLVLVDDEISTGRTLTHLAAELAGIMPGLRGVRFVSITDWLEESRRLEIAAALERDVEFHRLLRGRLRFEANAAFDPGPMPNVEGLGDFKDPILRQNHGRLGVRGPIAVPEEASLLAAAGLRGGERVLVLGTGEFVHAPFRFAQALEARGCDVHFQSTTRSPALVGAGIASALEFIDNYHDGIPNFVYNVADRRYDRILIGYETQPLPEAHRLPEMPGAQALFF